MRRIFLSFGAGLAFLAGPVLAEARPLAFEENRGQTDARVRYLARGPGYTLFLTPSEAVLAPHGSGSASATPLRLRWAGAAAAAFLSGEGELPGRIHDLRGSDPARWHTGIPTWERVRSREAWPGVDLVFYGNPGGLEYDFVVAPGADPRAIRLAVEGAERIAIDAAGDLVLTTAGGEARLRQPVSFQEAGGVRRPVESRWRRLRDGTFGLAVGRYDRTRPLVIDPVVVYSTYLGGSSGDELFGVATDAAGNTYVTGHTASIDFPGAGAQPLGSTDAFVSKLDPNGDLVWSSLLGGTNIDLGAGIGVDAGGRVAVAGYTLSADFPRIATSLPPPPHDLSVDVFVARLDPSGSSLLWAARLGGSDSDQAIGLAVDPAGHVYVVGQTLSPDFPVHAALQPSPPDLYNGFLMKLTPGGAFVYSTYLGGSFVDRAMDVAADSAGYALVTGVTASRDFPTRNAFQPALGGSTLSDDAFVLRVAPDGSALVWSTYLGGESGDLGLGIGVGPAGDAYVTGLTHSSDFPVRNAFQPVNASPFPLPDAFVARLSPAGSLVYSTYLGGSELDWGNDVAVDARGSAFVTGFTESTDFPVRDPFQAECRPAIGTFCQPDIYVAQIAPAGDAVVWASFLGGTGSEEVSRIAVDPAGSVSVAGTTYSSDFPTANAFQPVDPGGGGNGFVVRIAPNRPPDCSAAAAAPSTLWPPNGRMVPVSILGVTDPDGDPVALAVTRIAQDEPLSKKGQPDAAGIGTARPMLRADRAGGGDGRVYHLTFTATDPQGAVCTGRVTVCVPHNLGRRTCGDGGARFASQP